jgi:ribosomal protein S18 acetylase RimI-like enzyme
MADFEIREMRKDEISRAAEIQKSILSEERARRLKYDIEELLVSYIEKSPKTSLVAVEGDKVIGFMVGDIKEWSFGVERAGWIEIIGVDPQYMGQGVGKALGKALVERFKKDGVVDVYTSMRWDSGDLISFFKSIGFDKSSLINLKFINSEEEK